MAAACFTKVTDMVAIVAFSAKYDERRADIDRSLPTTNVLE
jgi:hypothetical protein